MREAGSRTFEKCVDILIRQKFTYEFCLLRSHLRNSSYEMRNVLSSRFAFRLQKIAKICADVVVGVKYTVVICFFSFTI